MALLAHEKQENRQDSAAIVESFKKGAREYRQKINELESTIKQNNNVQQKDKSKQQKELKKLRNEVLRLKMQKEEVVSTSNKKVARLQKTLNLS